MNTFPALLKELDEFLKRYNPINYSTLMPPLPKNEMNFFLMKLGIDDENVRHLFEWKNGVDVARGLDFSMNLFDFGVLYPLQAILTSVSINLFEYSNMIPLISNAGGERLLFNTNSGNEYGKIFLESTSLLSLEDEKYSIYDSVYTMIESNIEYYSKEAFKYDIENRRLIIDFNKYYEIAKEFNRNSSYWTRTE